MGRDDGCAHAPGPYFRGRRRPADDATDREVQTSGPASVRDMAPPTSAFLLYSISLRGRGWRALALPLQSLVLASSSPDSFASETAMPGAHPSAEFAPQPFEEPIRAELFGVERLEQHAESLAAAQPVMSELEKGRRLLPRVEDNGRVLREAYRAIAKAIREDRAITPAAEWLVDNFHIVDEQLREIRDDLPAGFYWQLPKLTEGPLAGYPRVYGIAWAFVAHTDSRFDPETLRRFVRAYQRIQALTIGELWAVAITLRVVLVEDPPR